MSNSDFWIFRDQREPVCGPQLLNGIRNLVRRVLHAPHNSDFAADAVIRAGSLECGLVDANAISAAAAARLTDTLAQNLLHRNEALLHKALAEINQLDVPQTLVISLPEGFSYYGLHPCDFSDISDDVPDNECYAVVGIRSVGTTLSGIVSAQFRLRGRRAERITVRPAGHPYDRTLQLTPEQRAWVLRQRAGNATFVIVDEGPGRSGSTFLSVAEALAKMGISHKQIVLIGSHKPDPASLCASNAGQRWRGLNFLAAERWACRKYKNLRYLGGGEWREFLIPEAKRAWPACWPQMERLKFLSDDGTHIIKFEGLGLQGERSRQRAQCLAESGFGPQFDAGENGFVRYRRIAPGPSQNKHKDISRTNLERLAQYCGFVSNEFSAGAVHTAGLEEMVNFNLSLEFGGDIRLPAGALDTVATVITDSRMHPHEWVSDERGRLLKTDGVSHGDDHFFPGPTDIAWDLAGAVIEWGFSLQAEEYFLIMFRRQTGNDARTRLLEYKIAYAMFRLAWCRMALPTTIDTLDESKLLEEISRYRGLLLKLLRRRVTGGRAAARLAA